MQPRIRYRKLAAISRTAVVAIVIVIIVIAGASGYYVLSQKGPTSSSSSAPTNQTTNTGCCSTTNSPGPSNKTTLVLGTNYLVDTLDNGYATGFPDAELDHQINPGLVKFQYGTANIVPDAAENWTVSSNGLVYNFTLNPNVKFNNGDPVNASTWVFSLDRNFNLGAAFFWMRPYFAIKNFTTPIINATGPYSLTMQLSHPYAAFLSVLATGQVYEPLDPNQINGSEYTGSNILSAGPYYVTSYTPNIGLDLAANPHYFGTPAATPNIDIKFYSSTSSLVLAAQSGEVDAVFGSLSPEEVSLAAGAPGFNLTQTQTPIPFMIGLNQKDAPLNNISARQALAYLTNRTQIVDSAYNGYGSPLYSIVPSGVLGANTSFANYYGSLPNITKAQSLLSSMGFSTSNPMQITLWYASGDTSQASTAALLSQQWEASGMVTVSLKTTDPATLESLTQVTNTTVEAWITDINPPFFDPDVFLSFFVSSQYRSTYNGGTNWSNSTVDSLINEERASNSSTFRAQITSEVQNMVAQQVVFIPYVQLNQQVEANKNVHGIILGGTTLLYMFLMYEPSGS